ncbi:Fc receptor-like protein 3, partial [Chiroxiphia lanceolata]|uniref:Fc receptor-like protein 3 n=1 Tax=Chiroxiphia lanceolata TaxID=296741 RepID=UPI0013CE736A
VTLTCQGSGTPGATTWYKNGRPWGQKGLDSVVVTKEGFYKCRRDGTGFSPAVLVSDDRLVLQVPAGPLLEGDNVTLRCRAWNKFVTEVRFYHEGKDLEGTELSLPPLQLHHGGRYHCGGKWWGISLSAQVTVTVHELFPVPVLEGPSEPTEGSPLNLSCLSPPSPLRPRARLLHLFYRDGVMVGGPQGSPQLHVPAVGVSHSGSYTCEVRSGDGSVRKRSPRLRVAVRRIPISGVSLSAQPPGGRVALGDLLALSCAVAAGTGPLSFSWHRGGSAAPLGTGPRLELHVGGEDSGHYQCRVTDGDSAAQSPPLRVTVLVPVANATITPVANATLTPVADATVTPGPPSHRVGTGSPVTLRCSVRAGSAPVTFWWLRDGREVARGPLLALGDAEPRHSGTYRCVATNQLDGHRVFRALSPELALLVTPRGHGDTAVAAGVGGSLLFLLLLLGAIGGWHRWHRRASKKPQDRAPPDPQTPPEEEGEVLYTDVVVTERAGAPRGSPSDPPQVTYAELPGPRGRSRNSSDSYENVL